MLFFLGQKSIYFWLSRVNNDCTNHYSTEIVINNYYHFFFFKGGIYCNNSSTKLKEEQQKTNRISHSFIHSFIMKGMKPQALRNLFRTGQAYLQHTNGSCPGYLQTNIVIIPKDVAEEFEQFCRSNSSSCPLIFKSNPGQVTAPLIGDDIDIRLVFIFH